MCCQCSGQKAHVSEARSLNGSSSDASLPETGILDLSIKELGHRLCADVKCVRRDSPDIESYPENVQLTQLAQQRVVKCAYNLIDGNECTQWLPLSELPMHHHGMHMAQPRSVSVLPEPQNSSAAPAAGFFLGRPWTANNPPLLPANVPIGGDVRERPVPGGVPDIGRHQQDRMPLFDYHKSPFLGSPRDVEANLQDIGGRNGPGGSRFDFPPREPLSGLPRFPVSELSKDIEGNKKRIDEMTEQMSALIKKNNQLETLVAQLSSEVANLGEQVQKLNERSQFSPENSGMLHWNIPDFKKDVEAAKLGSGPRSFYSNYFYGRSGHRLRARIYPDGDGAGKGTHVSVFLVIHKSDKDQFIEWPFKEKVTVSLVGSQGRVLLQEHFIPDENSSSFRRPVSDHNIASGIPLMVKQADLNNFLVDGALLLKIVVSSDQTRQPVMGELSGSSNPSQGRLYPKLSQMEH